MGTVGIQREAFRESRGGSGDLGRVWEGEGAIFLPKTQTHLMGQDEVKELNTRNSGKKLSD